MANLSQTFNANHTSSKTIIFTAACNQSFTVASLANAIENSEKVYELNGISLMLIHLLFENLSITGEFQDNDGLGAHPERVYELPGEVITIFQNLDETELETIAVNLKTESMSII